MTLYVIKYKGNHHKGISEKNYIRFEKECGLRPAKFFDEPERSDVVNFLEEFPFKGNVILHFQAHGFDTGITKLKSVESDLGDANSLITWAILGDLFNRISIKCDRLFVNMGTVCFSNRILPYLGNQNFDLLVSNTNVTDPVRPQQLNKEFIRLATNRASVVNTYDSSLDFCLKPNAEPETPIEPLGH